MKYNPDVIAIAGGTGKNLAQEAICAVLANKRRSSNRRRRMWRVRKSAGGVFWLKAINREIFSFFWRRSRYHQILVLEYGADQPENIKYLFSIVKPKIGVFVSSGDFSARDEHNTDLDGELKAKNKLAEYLPVSSSVLLNCDDEQLISVKERIKARVITFGFNKEADIMISNFESRVGGNGQKEISFKIEYQGSFVPVSLNNIFGLAQAYAVAAAFGTGIIYNLNLVEIAELLEENYAPITRN